MLRSVQILFDSVWRCLALEPVAKTLGGDAPIR